MMEQMMVDYRKLLVISCIVLQILDGLFTGYGAINSSLGIDVEGNPIVKMCMSYIGIIPALLIIKGTGIFAIHFMNRIKTHTIFFVIIFGLYFPVIALWVKVIFLDKLIR